MGTIISFIFIALLLSFIIIFSVREISVREYKKVYRRDRELDEFDRKCYQRDLEMLEMLLGDKVPEHFRNQLLTPTGHELVTWMLEHIKRKDELV